ncbi:MAG: tetratricopeptide repeat-containing sensor histidine kinase [Bacteroidales bacterium]|nr:tetratricopeptide repeat-containing sensor histidine kinase [Bacteroidales bacterium]
MDLLFDKGISWQSLLLMVCSLVCATNAGSQQLSKNDSLELNRLFNYSFQDSCSTETRYAYLDSIVDFSNKIDYPQGYIEMHYAKARILRRNNQYQKALEELSEGLMLSYQYENKRRERDIMLESVNVFLKLNLNDMAAATGENLLVKGLTNGVDSAILFNNIGIAYYNQNALDKSLGYFLRSIKIHKSNNDTSGMASTINNIGMVYEKTGNAQEAFEHYHQSSALYLESGQLKNYTTSLLNIGSLYIHQGEYEKAAQHYEKAELIADSINHLAGLANVHFNYAIIYQSIGEYDQSNQELRRSRKSFNELGIVSNEIECLIVMGQNYKKTNQFKAAKEVLNLALDKAILNSDMRLLKLINEELSTIHQTQNRYKEAFYYLNQSNLYNDTLQHQTNKYELEKLKLAYQTNLITEQFEQTLKRDRAILEIEINSQKKLTYIFLGAFIVFMFLFAWAIKNQLTINKQNKVLKQSNEAKNQLLSIIGHDLRGPVGTLVSFIEMLLLRLESINRDEMHRYLTTLKSSTAETYNLLENLLFWARSEKGEMNYQPALIHLEDICNQVFFLLRESASKDEVTIHINCEPELTAVADENMLKTILRNLVSNALKFTSAGGSISINIEKEEQHTLFSVKDTGVGMNAEIKNSLFKEDKIYTSKGLHKEQGTGLGLNLCLKFIKMHKGTIRVESEEGKGTTFYFTIPH